MGALTFLCFFFAYTHKELCCQNLLLGCIPGDFNGVGLQGHETTMKKTLNVIA